MTDLEEVKEENMGGGEEEEDETKKAFTSCKSEECISATWLVG